MEVMLVFSGVRGWLTGTRGGFLRSLSISQGNRKSRASSSGKKTVQNCFINTYKQSAGLVSHVAPASLRYYRSTIYI